MTLKRGEETWLDCGKLHYEQQTLSGSNSNRGNDAGA
jgi:hypothetical protein